MPETYWAALPTSILPAEAQAIVACAWVALVGALALGELACAAGLTCVLWGISVAGAHVHG